MSASPHGRSHPELAPDRIRADVADLLGCPAAEIGADEDLLDRGLDSIRLMSLVERWRQAGASGPEFADLAERPELEHWTRIGCSGRTGARRAWTTSSGTGPICGRAACGRRWSGPAEPSVGSRSRDGDHRGAVPPCES
jgi:aryl carrier-like protein